MKSYLVRTMTVFFCMLCLVQCTPTADIGEIATTDVTVTHAEIHFEGTSTLPTQACIETLLYEDGEVVAWWPATCANSHNGYWEIRVFWDTPERTLNSDATYTLRAWQRDEPAIAAEPFTFDMLGPPKPPPEDSKMDIYDWDGTAYVYVQTQDM